MPEEIAMIGIPLIVYTIAIASLVALGRWIWAERAVKRPSRPIELIAGCLLAGAATGAVGLVSIGAMIDGLLSWGSDSTLDAVMALFVGLAPPALVVVSAVSVAAALIGAPKARAMLTASMLVVIPLELLLFVLMFELSPDLVAAPVLMAAGAALLLGAPRSSNWYRAGAVSSGRPPE